MEDVELVIRVPKKDWKFLKESDGCRWSREIIESVINGIPLPKGHGDLIDANKTIANAYEVYSASGTHNIITSDQMYAIREVLTTAEPIIKADEEKEEKEYDIWR